MNFFRMRSMEPRDVEQVLLLCDAQNERDGTNYPVPMIFGPDGRLVENMPLALVAERNGEVRQACLFQRTVEMMCFGTDPHATAFSRGEMGRAAYLLRARGYDDVHCQVPRAMADRMERPLRRAGYERDDDKLAHFYRSLSEGER